MIKLELSQSCKLIAAWMQLLAIQCGSNKVDFFWNTSAQEYAGLAKTRSDAEYILRNTAIAMCTFSLQQQSACNVCTG